MLPRNFKLARYGLIESQCDFGISSGGIQNNDMGKTEESRFCNCLGIDPFHRGRVQPDDVSLQSEFNDLASAINEHSVKAKRTGNDFVGMGFDVSVNE